MRTEVSTKLGIRRLLKLAEHLRKGKLEHRKFFFGQWNVDKDFFVINENGCGFAGCAIGECPKAFPQHWHWKNGVPRLRGCRDFFVERHAQRFFGLTPISLNAGLPATLRFGGSLAKASIGTDSRTVNEQRLLRTKIGHSGKTPWPLRFQVAAGRILV